VSFLILNHAGGQRTGCEGTPKYTLDTLQNTLEGWNQIVGIRNQNPLEYAMTYSMNNSRRKLPEHCRLKSFQKNLNDAPQHHFVVSSATPELR